MDLDLFKSLMIERPEDEVINCNNETCSKCAGACCKNMGCHISPNDLKEVTKDSIMKLLSSDVVSIDRWEDDDPIYYLRIRNSNSKIIDYSWGGRCSILADNGCLLEYKYRPRGARELVPHTSHLCNGRYNKWDCVQEWKQFQKILKKVLKEITTNE